MRFIYLFIIVFMIGSASAVVIVGDKDAVDIDLSQFPIINGDIYNNITTYNQSFYGGSNQTLTAVRDYFIVDSLGRGNFTSISSAIAQVTNPTTIFVTPGTYTESQIQIPNNLDLRCAGSSSTILQYTGTDVFLIVEGDNVSISNCNIRATGNPSTAINYSSGVGNLRIENNDIFATLGGINAFQNSIYLRDTIIQGNKITIENSQGAPRGIVFASDKAGSLLIQNNLIRINSTSDDTDGAIGLLKRGQSAGAGRMEVISNSVFVTSNKTDVSGETTAYKLSGVGITTAVGNVLQAENSNNGSTYGFWDTGTFTGNHGTRNIANIYKADVIGCGTATALFINPNGLNDEKYYIGNYMESSSSCTSLDVNLDILAGASKDVNFIRNNFNPNKVSMDTANSKIQRDSAGYLYVPIFDSTALNNFVEGKGDIYYNNVSNKLIFYNGTHQLEVVFNDTDQTGGSSGTSANDDNYFYDTFFLNRIAHYNTTTLPSLYLFNISTKLSGKELCINGANNCISSWDAVNGSSGTSITNLSELQDVNDTLTPVNQSLIIGNGNVWEELEEPVGLGDYEFLWDNNRGVYWKVVSTASVPTWAQTLFVGAKTSGYNPLISALDFLLFGDGSYNFSTQGTNGSVIAQGNEITFISNVSVNGTLKVDNECGIPGAMVVGERSNVNANGQPVAYGNGDILQGFPVACSGTITAISVVCENCAEGVVEVAYNITVNNNNVACGIYGINESFVGFSETCEIPFEKNDLIACVSNSKTGTPTGVECATYMRFE